jgi:NTP pyrophosphatase (non-canonical NTP hydrolase)
MTPAEYEAVRERLKERLAMDERPIESVFRDLADLTDEWFSDTQGFSKRDVPTDLMLVVTELAEACEGDRKQAQSDKIEGFSALEEELADTLVRIFHMGGKYNLRLGPAFIAKMQMNFTRPYKHGKEY